MNEFSVTLRLVLCSLVAWRLTHLIVFEDGPWDIVARVRALIGDGVVGKAMDCFYCTSVWVAIPLAFVVGHSVLNWVLSWLAISGTASLLEKATNRELDHPAP